ncbi:Hypothetical protein, putative [Bodo saltans]|uniref:Uncharacterized protein n=1 Tax=Bodo saltans TaxID=75058 RepID=A0A0S4J136_BODSA|nr:Hypothetical protein, putative [Bodo saltans]|eukprot:CUG39341.1 Hypothetical protein, putative [Bodo saltans]
MPPTTRAAAAAAASTHNLPGETLVPSPTPPPPLPTLPSEGKEQLSTTTQTAGAAASIPPAQQQMRQTRRNTQTVSNDQGTHVMDPWKDDRLRDFVAINVLTRIRSFHLPDDAPLAGAGSINKQRVDQLYLLPRTKARCSGDATDCPLRRVFCRIFGPAALHHEQHSASSTVVLFDEGVKATPLFSAATPLQMKSATDREEALVASPDPAAVHLLAEDPASSASEVVAAVIKREDGEEDEEQAAQVAARRSLFGDDDHDAAIDSTVAIKSESVDVLTESITTVVSADETQQLSPTFGPTPPSVVPVLPATASSSSLPSAAVPHSNPRGQSVATTAGSATPADYRSDLDCHCCTDCVDAMCAHYQSLLTRGVIFDRFSQKDFLFAHWVLFQNMEGAAMDSHGALSRKEALSIQVKSGYYDLLKVPRSEDEVLQQALQQQQQQSTSSPPMPASVTPGAALLPAAPSSSSDQAVVAEGGTNSGSATTSTIAPPPRKRNRLGTTTHHNDEPLLSAKVKFEDEDEGVPAATPTSSGSYLKDAGSARRPSRRTEATQPIDAATAAAPSASSATMAASEMPPPPRKGRANQYTKARDLALAAAAAAAAAEAAGHPIAVKKEEPSSPTATSRTSTPSHSSSSNNNTRAGSTATSDSGDAKNQWSVPPVLSLGGGGSSSSSLSTQLLSLSMMTSTAKLSKHARIRMRDEEAAIMVLLGCDPSSSSAVATTPTTTPTSPHADEKDFASATVGSGSGLAQYHQLVAENRHPVQSTRESVTSARILEESEELRRQKIQAATPQKPTTGIQITRTSRRGQTSELSSSSAGSHDDRDDASLVTTAATNAMAEEPLRHYTFEQQCLLLLAASRWIDPDVAVGPLFLPSVTEETEESSSTARPIRNTVNYWSAKAVAATLDPPSRGVHLTPYAHDM